MTGILYSEARLYPFLLWRHPLGELPRTGMNLAIKYMLGYYSDLLHKLLWETFLDLFWSFPNTVTFMRGRWAANWYKCSLANSIYFLFPVRFYFIIIHLGLQFKYFCILVFLYLSTFVTSIIIKNCNF